MLNTFISLLAVVNRTTFLVSTLTIGFGALIIGAGLGILIYKKAVVAKTLKAKETAEKIVEDAIAEAKVLKKESILDAKEQASDIREAAEIESRQRRSELIKSEDRLNQREDFINSKEESLDRKQDNLDKSKEMLVEKEQEVILLKQEAIDNNERIIMNLERSAGLTRDDAKKQLIENYQEDAKKDAAILIRELEQDAKENAEKNARNIITLAIQKYAADQSNEVTVSAVSLPSDEMKGRLIGREGRNIRALEAATGVDLIVDDTPDTVVVSSFDPVRREIAKITLEKLMLDGRIQPTKIEEMVGKVTRDINQIIKKAGEDAVFDADINGMHPELIKLLGRLKYRTSYGQNVLKHSMEVSFIAGMMASEIGANVKVAKRGGLLHDIGKAIDHQVEGTHVEIGVDLATKYKESEAVIHCIAAHHGDVEYHSIEAILVQAADAISSARPGARRENLDNYIKRLKRLEEIANEVKGVDKAYAIQAGREIRIIVKPDEVDDKMTVFIAKDIAQKIESELQYPGQIKVNVVRELRTVSYAK